MNTRSTKEELIAVFEFSLFRQIKFNLILFGFAMLFFMWWLEIRLADFLIPSLFLFLFVGVSLAYAWIKKEQFRIEVSKSGLLFQKEYLSWNEIETLSLKKYNVETIHYSLIVCMKDLSIIEGSLEFLNKDSQHIFHVIKKAFEASN